MKTFQNTKIVVTVTNEIYESFRGNAEYCMQINSQAKSVEHQLRALILSAAMQKLGNLSEYRSMQNCNAAISKDDILNTAKDNILIDYITKHTKYKPGETLKRHFLGARMSDGMVAEIARGLSYARGVVDQIKNEHLLEILKSLDINDRRALENLRLATGRGHYEHNAADEIVKARAQLVDNDNELISYRKSRSKMDGWDIRIIGEMPKQIGLCGFDELLIDELEWA